MIPDVDTNVIYISDLLEPRYPLLVSYLRGILSDHGVPLKVIRRTADIWVRDFMPVQVGPGEYVRFRYAPDYLDGYEHLITDFHQLDPIPEIERCRASDVILDGGNVVDWGRRCLVTDKVFRENPKIARGDLLGQLRELLAVEEVLVVPNEPGDVTGHADGIVRFLDEETVVINDYSQLDSCYWNRLTSALRRARLRWVAVPYRPIDGPPGELPPAFGNYVNFLRVGDLVVLPGYGIPEDDQARRVIQRALPGVAVVQVDCSALSTEGGALNCATWGMWRNDESYLDHPDTN
jgi:agmatine deiminase